MTFHLTHKVQPPKSTPAEHIPVHEGRLHTLPAPLACLWLLFVRPHHLIDPLAFRRSHRWDERYEADLCHVTPAVHSRGGKSWWAQRTEIQDRVCSVPTSWSFQRAATAHPLESQGAASHSQLSPALSQDQQIGANTYVPGGTKLEVLICLPKGNRLVQ